MWALQYRTFNSIDPPPRCASDNPALHRVAALCYARSAVMKHAVLNAGKIVLVILGNNRGPGRSAGKVLHAEMSS